MIVGEGSVNMTASGETLIVSDGTPGGVYKVMLDLSSLAAGVFVDCRLYVRVRAGLAPQRLRYRRYTGTMNASTPAKMPIQNFDGIAWVTDVQTRLTLAASGTPVVKWKLYKIGFPTVDDEGTYTPAILNTEYVMKNSLVPGVFYAQVDCSAMQAGDATTLTVETRVRGADTTGKLTTLSLSGAQDGSTDALSTVKDFNALTWETEHETNLKINQTAGTLRSYPWKLFRIA